MFHEDFDRPRLYRSAIPLGAADFAPWEAPGVVFDIASRKLHAIADRELAPIRGFEVLLLPMTNSGFRLILLTPRRLTEEEEGRVSRFVGEAFSAAIREWHETEAKAKKG